MVALGRSSNYAWNCVSTATPYCHARVAFERAISVAEEAGDKQGAGLAALTMVEELSQHLTNNDLCATVDRAAKLLGESGEIAIVHRLAKAASYVLCVVRNYLELQPTVDWTKISFPDAVRRYEAHFIKLALQDASGKITHAADKTVAGIVKEMLEDQGWHVETCADGNAGLDRIAGDNDYDLLLVDYDLPGVNGIELINHARELDHRCDTPMIVLAASPVAATV